MLLGAFGAARSEATTIEDLLLDTIEENSAAEYGIEVEYRRKLAGIRFLPRKARAGARREARDWRRAALKALRERRSLERNAKHEDRRKRNRWRDAREHRPPGPT